MSSKENLFCEKCGTKIDDFEADVCSGKCFDCCLENLAPVPEICELDL